MPGNSSERIHRDRLLQRRAVAIQATSAVDNCLWSIQAQAAGVPLSDLQGGTRPQRLPDSSR